MLRLSAFLVAALLAAPVRSQTGVGSNEVRIGSCSPLSGKVAALGGELINGAQAYFNEINARGGVHGRRVKLLTFDDGYDPERAILCFKQMTDASIFAGGFFAGAPTVTKYIPMAESMGLPVLGFSAGSEFISDPARHLVFATRASVNELFGQLVDAAWNAGYRRFAIIYQDDALGASALRGTKLALLPYGTSLVAEGSFSRENPNTTKAAALVRRANPDAVMVIGFGAPAAAAIKDARRHGWRPLFLSVTQDPAFLQLGGKELDGVVMAQVVPNADQTELPGVAGYRKALARFFPEAKPSVIGLSGWVMAHIFVEGLDRAGKDLTRERFVSALESIRDLDVGLGPKFKARYGADNHKAFDRGFLTVIVGGRLHPIESIPRVDASSKR